MSKHRLLKTSLLLGGVGYLAVGYTLFKRTFDLESSTFVTDEFRKTSLPNEELDRWFIGLPREDVFIESHDHLQLHALMIEGNPKSNRWMIVVHGYQGRSLDMKYYLKRFYGQIQNFLVIDQRGCGLSKGIYTGMGWLEHYDLIGWIKKLVSLRPESQIMLLGISLGATTIMNTVGNELPEQVKCAIEDSGFSDMKDIISYQFERQTKLKAAPFLTATEMFMKQTLDFSFAEASTRKQLIASRTPMLFIHGDQDTIVPASMVKENYYACGYDKQLCIYPNRNHGECILEENYVDVVMEFANHYMK